MSLRTAGGTEENSCPDQELSILGQATAPASSGRSSSMLAGMKKYMHWFGSAVAVIGIFFVAIRLRDYSSQIDFKDFGQEIWWVVGGCAVAYSIANNLMALAWWNLLVQFGAVTPRRWAIRTYGISQLAKYVPGNIFHLAGRQAMGMAAGVSGWSLAKSTFWELGMLAIAGSLFGALVLPLLVTWLPLQLGLIAFVLALAVVAVAFAMYFGPAALRAFGLYVTFVTISGVLFVCLIEMIFPSAITSSSSWIVLCSAYIVAWLIGLVTPGAPAGVGVRELILVFLLHGLVGENELVLTVVLGRVVTVTGDFLFFVVSWLQKN
jgi:glycosyltransferase 2 family protein